MEQFDPKTLEPTVPTALDCLGNDLVAFTISEYLPGEYVLRIFPLICKATQSRRLSLSLLGAPSFTGEGELKIVRHPAGTSYFAHEGPIYGIYSFWRDFQRIVACGHALHALKLDGQLDFMQGRHTIIGNFLTSLDHFPRLSKIEICDVCEDDSKALLMGLWKLPLTSLSCRHVMLLNSEDVESMLGAGPPVFAQTLRTLKSRITGDFPDLLSLYCKDLQDIEGDREIRSLIAKNTGLTALSLTMYPSEVPDITEHTSLTKLTLSTHGTPFNILRGIHSSLEEVTLNQADPGSARQFLLQCPALKHVSIIAKKWDDIVQITSVLDPSKCNQLTVKLTSPGYLPTLREVDRVLLQRGFQLMNRSVLLTAKNVDKRDWRRIVTKIAPEMKGWGVLQLEGCGDYPRLLSSFLFPVLSSLSLDSRLQWTQEMLTTVMERFPTLKEFQLVATFSGELALQSPYLHKLSLSLWKHPVASVDLKLPNLTHLSLHLISGGIKFLQQLLNGDPLIQLPQLRVLFIYTSEGPTKETPMPVTCTTGHQSLTELILDCHSNLALPVSTLKLRKLPCLRQLKLVGCSRFIEVIVDLPGRCEINLGYNIRPGDPINYHRYGHSDPANFMKKIIFSRPLTWIEVQESKQKKKKRKGQKQRK